MNIRLNQLRLKLDLTMKEFGDRIGVSRSTISRLESGIINFTEQMIKSICREFNVDYIWFTTGEGEMFSEEDNDYMALIDKIMSDSNSFPKTLFKAFARFSEEDWKALEHMIDIFLEEERKDKK